MADTVNLKKSYSALNEKLTNLFDGSGVRRSFTVPYVDGQAMADHISAVGQAAAQSGGLTGNLLTSAHHSGGKGWGSGDGQTVGHPGDKLRTTIIPKDDETAKAAIAAAQTHLNNIEKLIGDKEPSVVTAKNQLDLVKKTDGAGMNLLDFGVMMIQLMYGPTQAAARAHDRTKPGGMHPKLRAPVQEPSESQGEPSGASQTSGEAPETQSPVAAAPAAPAAAAPPSPAVGAPVAAPQAA